MAEKEYIERKAAMKAILGQPPEPHYPEWYYRDIKEIPAADVVEVRHGRWIPHEHMSRTPYARNYDCSECGISPIECENYCPNCGAKMDGGEDG